MLPPWDEQYWRALHAEARTAALRPGVSSPRVVAARARSVLKAYSTSFFLVTRFLPPSKRAEVEVIYASVRYPDEIVDTFPLSVAARLKLLDEWEQGYERGLQFGSVEESLEQGVPAFLAAFTEVVLRRGIPPGHYRAFLNAMRMDAAPRRFHSLDDLIETYIYGSATVVGYFLAHVYGEARPGDLPRALQASRHLAIALQLTNFLRDVGEDQRRGRTYLPLDLLHAEGVTSVNVEDAAQRPALNRVLHRISVIAEAHYSSAQRDGDAFSPDCRTAILACISVYRELNVRIGRSTDGVLHRESVPLARKFRVLPPSKYWRLPLAYLGAI